MYYGPSVVKPFPSAIGNIVAKGEIGHNEQFLLLPQGFQVDSIITLSLIKRFKSFLSQMFSNSSAAILLYAGMGILCSVLRFCALINDWSETN